jgi:hypothetical protein
MLKNLDSVLGDTRHRVRLAAGLVGVLWLGVAWAHWSPSTRSDAPTAPPTYELRLLAAEGQPSPAGGLFDRFHVASQPIVTPLNRKGQVAFFATLLRGGADEGIFRSEPDGRVGKIAVAGDPAPGGGTLSSFAKHPIVAMNENGTVAFTAAIAGGRAIEGVFVHSAGKLRGVALTGMPAPGIVNGAFADFESPAVDEADNIVFLANVRRGREAVEGIFLFRGGELRKVVAAGDPAPGGGAFAAFGMPSVNSTGAVAFTAVVEKGDILGGVYLHHNGEARLLVGAGDKAPDGSTIAKFSERVALNESGTVAFNAILKYGPSPAAVLRVDGGNVSIVAKIGDPAPDGGKFGYLGLWPVLSDSGALTFIASLEGSGPGIAIFQSDGVKTRRLVALGDTLPAGQRLVSFGLYPVVSASAAGQVAFATSVTSTGQGKDGIYAQVPVRRR